MSAAVGAALKKVLVAILTEPKVLKNVLNVKLEKEQIRLETNVLNVKLDIIHQVKEVVAHFVMQVQLLQLQELNNVQNVHKDMVQMKREQNVK